MADYEVLLGDCVASMRTLAGQSVNTCVTSPPYFGLRDYDHPDQIGLEPTPDAYVARLVEVFREVRRVLRADGTLWLNIGDSYVGYHGNKNAAYTDAPSNKGGYFEGQWKTTVGVDGLKNKDLIGIPWRVAFALQADGWYLRQDIIWSKPNPMPESVRDRCTKAHEYIFLLSKEPRYYFDQEAVMERLAAASEARLSQINLAQRAGAARVPGKTNGNMKAVGRRRGVPPRHAKYESSDQSNLDKVGRGGLRNRRSVWTVSTKPYRGAHFATFPPDLIEPCILAGSPLGGVVLDPFGGSGITAGVAIKNGRRAVLCELNADYLPQMSERVRSIAGETRDLFLRPEAAP